MSLELIIGVLIGFITSEAGRKLIIYIWNKLGDYVQSTENDLDESVYDFAPNILDFIVDNFELGVAEKILENFLEDLEKMDENTTELEDIIKEKEEDIKK